MKGCFFLMLFATCAFIVSAQNTEQTIRNRYASVKEYIASHNEDNPNDGATWAEFYHVEAQQMLPGTGGHREDMYMYWDECEGGTDLIYPKHRISFATARYNFAAMTYYEEFLYDADGSVAFIYAHDPYNYMEEKGCAMERELRFYMNRGKLIKADIRSRYLEEGEQYETEYVGVTLNKEEYKEQYNLLLKKAAKIRSMFTAVETVAYDYEE